MTDQRTRWRDFICSTEHPGRHLASLGRNVSPAYGDALPTSELEAFLLKLDGAQNDIRHLSTFVDLLSGDYTRFMESSLPRLLDILAAEADHEDVVVGPALVGNPRWDRTTIGRMSGRLRPGQYVSRTARRSYELPENALLRWLVADLAKAVVDLRRRSEHRLHDKLEKIAVSAAEAHGHHLFGTLTTPFRIDASMVSAARRRRRPEYTVAADLASRRAAFGDDDEGARWHSVLMLLAVGWVEPVDIDDLFELYSLVTIIDVISSELGFGDPDEFGLVTAGRKQVATFMKDAKTVKVFFDQSPQTAIRVEGRYPVVIKRHSNVSGKERRPDIIITLERSGEVRRILLVEVKKTANGTYISDSIYKVFGYLHDFGACWPEAYPRPKVVLLVPEGVGLVGAAPEVVIASAEDRMAIAHAMRAALLA